MMKGRVCMHTISLYASKNTNDQFVFNITDRYFIQSPMPLASKSGFLQTQVPGTIRLLECNSISYTVSTFQTVKVRHHSGCLQFPE
jgi:hypothetical protein